MEGASCKADIKKKITFGFGMGSMITGMYFQCLKIYKSTDVVKPCSGRKQNQLNFCVIYLFQK